MSDFSNTDSSTGLVLHEVEGEMRILDLDIGSRLGFARPRDIRKIIDRNLENLNKISRCAIVERRPENGGRDVQEYYLDQKQAIFICMKSETATAIEVQMDIVRVYDQHLKNQQPALPQDYLAALKALVTTEEAKQRLEAQNRALNQQIETEKPYAELARAITGKTAITRRDWAKLMKTDHGLRVGERAVNQWLFDKGYLFKDARTGTTRAYAKYEDQGLFEQDAEVINGKPRFIVKITGEGIKKLTPKVLAHFAEKVYVFEDFI